MTIERSPEFIVAALYLSRCGRVVEGKKPLPPQELGTDSWQAAYAIFFDHLGSGRPLRAFHNSLKATRDQFDSHVDSGRRGWLVDGKPKPLPELDTSILAEWQNHSDEDLWETVRPWTDLEVASVPASVLNDLEADSDEDEEEVAVGREGKMRAVVSKRRERSPKLRAAALQVHGCHCQICGFDFGKAYGQWGVGFAEVHHMQELRSADVDGVETDPTTDLAVLCSNCHRMLHRKRKRVLSLDELRSIMETARLEAK